MMLLACLFATTVPAATRSLPTRTLDDRSLRIPADLPANRSPLLVVGFSMASRTQSASWQRCVAADAGLRREVDTYQVAVLEDVPKPFRGAVIAGIRGDVPATSHGRFLLVTSQQAEWKAWTKFAEPDAAYVLLVRGGVVAWQSRGSCGANSLEALRRVLATAPAP